MNAEQSIGIFDSGVGGITIWKEITKMLPNENTIYLADSKNAPYGQRSKDKILELSYKNTEFLLQRGCKIIVVACNTATTNAIAALRSQYTIPFIGIEPAIKPAALKTKTNAVGILATKGTLSSDLFHKTSEQFGQGVVIVEQVGEGLVKLIEQGALYSSEMKKLLHNYLTPMLEQHIDYLVLGCSHYPFLIPQIREIIGPHVTIIDSGEAVARQTQAVLHKKDLLNTKNTATLHRLVSNTSMEVLQQFAGTIKKEVTIEKIYF